MFRKCRQYFRRRAREDLDINSSIDDRSLAKAQAARGAGATVA